jgi:murein L,D-transpeptidase YafK
LPTPGLSPFPRDFQAPTPPARPNFTAVPKLEGVKGAPVYVRIFKREGQLELWQKKDGRYGLVKSYPICKWSGVLGPKQKEADYQSPEGFYSVSAKQLKPNSSYFRAFNVGYPNALDKQHGRTGGLIMVHGDCKSVGCFAMTNQGIGEIYGYVEAALRAGQREVPVHIFPFRLTEGAIERETPTRFASLFGGAQARGWSDFWRDMKVGYDLFEQTREPPVAFACAGRYRFGSAGAGCARISGW